jgi:hypothetical protein
MKEDKISMVIDKIVSSFDDIKSIEYFEEEDEYFFEYPQNICWSVTKSDEGDYTLFLYPKYEGDIKDLVRIFAYAPTKDHWPSFETYNTKEEKYHKCKHKISILYTLLETKYAGVDDVINRILSL